MKNVLGIVILSVSTVFSALLIVLGVILVNRGKANLSDTMMKVQRLVSVEESDFSRVNQDNLQGLEVVQLLRKFDNSGFKHQVINKAVPNGYYSVDSITDPDSDEYIKPDQSYRGKVVRDERDTPIGVKFIENGVQDVDFDVNAARKVGISSERKIQNREYEIFCQFYKYNEFSNDLAELYSMYLQALKTNNSKKLLEIYKAFSKDVEFDKNPNATQKANLTIQRDFLTHLKNYVKVWTDVGWWGAIIDANSSIAEHDPSADSILLNDDDGNDWGNSNFADTDVGDDDGADADDSDPGGDSWNDDMDPDDTPEPTLEPTPTPTPYPVVTPNPSGEVPIAEP